MSTRQFPPLHPAHNNLNNVQQQQAEAMMDSFTLPQSATTAPTNSPPPRHPNNIHLAGINTSSVGHRIPSNIPSSPVSPMLESDGKLSAKPLTGAFPATAPGGLHKENSSVSWSFATAVDGKATAVVEEDVHMHSEADERERLAAGTEPRTSIAHPLIALTPPQQQVQQQTPAPSQPSVSHTSPIEEHMSRDDDEELNAQAHAHLAWEAEQAMQLDEDVTGQMMVDEDVEYEEDEDMPSTSAAPTTPSTAALTREEKLAFEEKMKQRKKFAEMRYLVNNMYRCQDCMLAATDMEQGFDEHAPPRRPAARPSAGPGSDLCCYGPALAEALPADFPVDLIPIMHSYLLSDAPSRSFLTTPPLPSQGTLMCYILKTHTRFDLYLEMKNQETFIKMRKAKEDLEKKRREREERRGSESGLTKAEEAAAADATAAAASSSADAEMTRVDHPVLASSSSTSSLLPSNTPTLTSAHSEPLPSLIVRSLDDSEVGLRSQTSSIPASSSGSGMLLGANLTPGEYPGETPAELHSPTHSIDYEKLFPEPPPSAFSAEKQGQKGGRRRIVRSASGTPELRGIAGPMMQTASQLALSRPAFPAGGVRRQSEPVIFAPSGARAAAAAAAGRRTQQPNNGVGSAIGMKVTTPQQTGARRLSTGSSSSSSGNSPILSALSSALPPPESNLHLHSTRTNAINRMLKDHAETIIAEGKDIFLLCAQRKRSWAGNYYLISSDRENIKPEGPSFMGKLKSNFGGTDYVVTDNGVKSPSRRNMEKLQTHMYPTYSTAAASAPKEPPRNAMAQWLTGSSSSSAAPHVRHELACILYDHFYEHSGSPIRIKVLLPNRAFDLATEAAVSGSILKQYKMECEKQEKAKQEREAKQLLLQQEDAKKQAQHQPQHSTPDHSHANPDAMTDIETTLVEATQAAMASVASSSSTSHNSGAVAPALSDMPPSSSEINCSVETYENLRPVWHDGMNAYVLHFDHHRVREKSVKNFRLVRSVPDPNSKTPGATIQHTVLQFGRVLDRNVFVMDYGYPLSALSAFAICLSSIDPKLAV